MSTVVVAGALAGKPGSAGEAWVRMSWVRGLAALGLDVWFAEEAAPDAEALAWWRAVTERFGIAERSFLVGSDEIDPALHDIAAEATLVNISGNLARRDLLGAFRQRVLVDIDPGFTQYWHADGLAGARVAGHDLHFTIGELIGTPECPIPTGGIDWLHVRQPVVLDDWPVAAQGGLDRFTTIATWRGPYGPVTVGHRTFGLKVHEFRKLFELPRRAAGPFELALDIHPGDDADRIALEQHGWWLVDPPRDPDQFRAYVQGSAAEFSVAQGVYVETRCGWFSDRSTRYLASGRPVLVQDTGFSDFLPVGDGLVAFTDLDSAVAGAADIAARYDEHCAAARSIAEEHFASDRVLARFCEQAGIG